MPARPYHIPCYACQTIPYSIPCSPGHTIYHMRCPPGFTIYHAMPTMPYHTMPCTPGHAIYHVMPANFTIYQAMYARLCHAMPRQTISYTYAHQAILYAMPYPTGHTIYHAMPARTSYIPCHASPGHNLYHAMPAMSYHIPCYAKANDYFGKAKVRSVSLPDALLLVNSLVRWFRFIVCHCGSTMCMWKQAWIILTVLAVISNRSPRTSTIVQFIFHFWSFEISERILRN